MTRAEQSLFCRLFLFCSSVFSLLMMMLMTKRIGFDFALKVAGGEQTGVSQGSCPLYGDVAFCAW